MFSIHFMEADTHVEEWIAGEKEGAYKNILLDVKMGQIRDLTQN